jgi:hypothetical protein
MDMTPKEVFAEHAKFFAGLLESKDFDNLNEEGIEWVCELIQAVLDSPEPNTRDT